MKTASMIRTPNHGLKPKTVALAVKKTLHAHLTLTGKVRRSQTRYSVGPVVSGLALDLGKRHFTGIQSMI